MFLRLLFLHYYNASEFSLLSWQSYRRQPSAEADYWQWHITVHPVEVGCIGFVAQIHNKEVGMRGKAQRKAFKELTRDA